MSVRVLTMVTEVFKFSLLHHLHYKLMSVCVLTMVMEVLKFSLVHHSHYGCLSMSVSVSELTVVTEVFSLVYYTILTTINVCLCANHGGEGV